MGNVPRMKRSIQRSRFIVPDTENEGFAAIAKAIKNNKDWLNNMINESFKNIFFIK